MRQTNKHRTTLRLAAKIGAGVIALAALYSCSLIVENRSQQCEKDEDCVMFSGAKCDVMQGICVGGGTGGGSTTSTSTTSTTTSTTSTTTSTTSSGGGCDVDGGIQGGGCYNCAPTNDEELLNRCTDGCIGFDNKRVTLLPDGGQLPPLP
jgi:hypothetical protein